MYESPISIIERAVNDLLIQQEEGVFRAIKEYGISVDREELIKALNYDRNQYNKGYADGVREFAEKVKALFPSDLNFTTISRFTLRRIAKEMGVEL